MNNSIDIFLISFSVSVHLALVLHSIKMLFTAFLIHFFTSHDYDYVGDNGNMVMFSPVTLCVTLP